MRCGFVAGRSSAVTERKLEIELARTPQRMSAPSVTASKAIKLPSLAAI